MELLFDTAALPERDRAAAWMDTTARALVTTDCRLLDVARFRARLHTTALGAGRLSVMSYGPLRSRRTPGLIRRSDPEHYQVAVILSGRQRLEQAGNRALLHPGDMVFYDTSRAFDARVEPDETDESGSESLLLQFPRRLLPLAESDLARLLAVPLSGRQGIGRVMSRFLTELAAERHRCGPQDLARLGSTAIDLVVALLAHHLGDEHADEPSRSPREVLFLRVTTFVEQHLHHPELTPAAIARAHQISLRYLHRIFQEHGTSVGAYVRDRRMDRCRRDLSDPGLRHLPVQAIGARWGYPGPSEFSRAFRTATGLPPGRYRDLAHAAGGDGRRPFAPAPRPAPAPGR
ncbi:helix-turn-helix domain-containing protein [Streptomyces sp. NPDC014864]|uniref:AraC-like ligand-binding domain-containing protein n=1 Tax=Streptomyces sp. NPDC014864 TaxID=3364924 RepID=UPI0036FA448D